MGKRWDCPGSGRDEDDDVDAAKPGSSEGGGGPHFLPKRPIERARASDAEYSTPSSVKSSERLNLNCSGRLPACGGVSIGS